MKKAKIAAALVLAAAVSTATLAACGSGSNLGVGKFNIADYAHPLDSVYSEANRTDYADTGYVNQAFTKLTKKDFTSIEDCGDYTKIRKQDGTYSLYDVKNDKELQFGYDSIYTGTSYGVRYYTLGAYTTSNLYRYKIAGPDGNLLTSAWYIDTSVSIETMGTAKTVSGDVKSVTYYKVTLPATSEGAKGEVMYYTLTSYYGKDDAWKSVSKVEAEAATGEKYAVGSQLGLVKENIPVNNNYYPVNNYEGIEYTTEGSDVKTTYTYYKDGEKISSVTVNNGTILGYVGDYVYYCEAELVKSDATKGYNLEMTSTYTIKTNVSLYRYNFMKDKGKKEIDLGDYVVYPVAPASSLYNYSTDKIDALALYAIKKVDGVAVVAMNSGAVSSIIVGENGKAIADLSGTNVSSTEIYKLGEDSYLAGGYILDGKLNTIAELPSSSNYIWADKGLIRTNYNGTMFVDFTGKVVIKASSDTTYFYGDIAVNNYSNATTVYSTTHSTGKAISEIVTAGEDEYVYTQYGFIIKSAYDSRTYSYTFTLYNLNGVELQKIENSYTSSLYFDSYNGGYVVEAYGYNGSEYYVVG